ncbi:MAG TPA: hypothetical protein HA263_12330 [Methanoregulaceae archaeon]|nr:hypothetical protein [Methanoregulaceae archaeon]
MERSLVIVVVLGLVAAAGLFLVSPYLSLMALIITGVAVMALAIGRDASDLPDIEASLAEDARAVALRNNGNAPALQVHASFVPIGVEVDLPTLAVEAIHEEPLPEQVTEVKVVVTYRNSGGQAFRRTVLLSALRAQDDPLRPTFAIFGWK